MRGLEKELMKGEGSGERGGREGRPAATVSPPRMLGRDLEPGLRRGSASSPPQTRDDQ